ncbi:MAG TPA: META domain-containing protein [Acidimicrobiales bacterium]|nr:META domain-containing protein [Acidimicrobiales bacterium]
MTGLEELLERAAEAGPVGFTTDDIQDRVRRRGRVRRAAASGFFVLLLAGVVGVVTIVSKDEGAPQQVDTALGGRRVVGGVDLIGRWKLSAVSEVTVVTLSAHLEFTADGILRGDDGCNAFTTTWTVEADRLLVGQIDQTERDCGGREIALIELLSARPRIGPFEWPDSLKLSTADRFIAFDRVGRR